MYFSDMLTLKKHCSYIPFIKNPLDNALNQNEVINQERGKCYLYSGKKALERNWPWDDPDFGNSTKEFKAPVMTMFKDLKENI